MNELQKRRKELGITQTQAANACGVSRRTYQTYEETDLKNETFNILLTKLDEMGILDGSNHILNLKFIKFVCRDIFSRYPQIKCAYLYGSYARGEATGKSDVDILVVCHGIGMDFFEMESELEDLLHKKVDLQTHEQIVGSEQMLEDILVEGVKIYG